MINLVVVLSIWAIPSPSSGCFVMTRSVHQRKIVKGGKLQKPESSLICVIIAEGSSVWTWVLVTRTGENSKGRTVLEPAIGCRWRIKRWTVVSYVGVLASLMCRVCVEAVWMKAGQVRNKFLCAQIWYDDDDDRMEYGVKPSTLMLEQKEFDRPHLGTKCSFTLDITV